ncbi:site-specific integrase [uncultured Merdimonas sp.]|uniref:site-specific integrase n=1 Tax=uncultured Merdimonas sp. TaxID=2023269 RepID=UPI00320AB654
MAVIKNKKTNTYEVRTYYKDWTGVRKQKTKRGFKRKCDAQDWERAFKLKENRSLDMTFGDFVNIYLNDIKPRIKYNTWLTKKHIVDKKILPYFTDRKLQEIKTADIRQWQNMIMNHRDANGKGYSQVYLKTIHNQMSAILNHAVNFYDLKSNVARKAGSMGKEKSKEMLFWTKEEYTQFIEAVADKPISFYAFEIFYWCGLRMGELLALTPADLDFRSHTIRINKLDKDSGFEWIGEYDISADDLLSGNCRGKKIKEAKELLLEILADGAVEQNVIVKKSESRGMRLSITDKRKGDIR